MVITTAPVCRDSTEWPQLEERGLKPPMMEELLPTSTVMEKGLPDQALKCPRCDSSNTKFCYYNNYSLSQPRHFCKTCKRYWTRGGTLRNVPVGGGCRKNKRVKRANTADHANPPSQIEDPTSNAQSTDLNKTTMHSPLFYSLAKSAAAVDINLRFPSLRSQSSLAENLRGSTRNNSDFIHDPLNTIGLNFCGPAGGNQDEDQHVSNFMQEQIAFNPLQTSDLAASSSALLPYFSHMGSSLSLGGINANNNNIGSDVSESQWKLFQQHKLPLTSGLLVPYEELQTLGDGSVLRPENLRSLGSSAVKIEEDQNNKLSQFEWRVPCENPLETGGSDSHLYWNPVVTPWHDLTSYGSSVTPLI